MELNGLGARQSSDARRFLRRGVSLLDAVVLIKVDDDKWLFNGLRITQTLVISLRTGATLEGSVVTVNGTGAEVAWEGSEEVLLFRTARYEGALPELSLAAYQGNVTFVWTNPEGETRIGFGRAQAGAKHDAPNEGGSLGAPLFDEAWGVVGLHKTYDGKSTCGYVPIAQLARELEQSPVWDEIAAVHRLVREVAMPAPPKEATSEPDLARAVRWSTGDEAEPMSERERKRAMAGKSLADLKYARGAAPATTPEQRAVDRVLAGPPYTADTIEDDILLPFATAVRWFRGVVPDLPDDEALEREVTRRRQHAALVSIVGPRFAPRQQESARLSAWLADRDRAAMVVRGPGGIGKSALLAHFILDNERALRFAWVDFDRPDVSADEPSIARVVDQQLAWQAPEGLLLVVLDSFETAVQTFGYTNLNPALDALAKRFDNLAIVVGTRAPVPLLKIQGEPAREWTLSGLPFDVVTQWLLAEGVAPEVVDDIAALTNGVPLNMKLARDLVKGKSVDEAREIVAELPKQLVTGYLYRRILRRLRDETLKDQAQWAMVPRRLVPELLAAILHVTKEESERLFAALRSELTLLEGDAMLTVRADLRNTLLPLLEAEDAERVREIDAISAEFWSARASEDVAAAEAVYHALRLADTARAQLLWRDGVATHLGAYAMEELPDESQAWLEARLSDASAEQATEGLVAGGDLVKAAANLRVQSQDVSTLKGRKRRRAFQTLEAESSLLAKLALDASLFADTAEALLSAARGQKPSLNATPAAQDQTALESTVLTSSRPAILVRDGTFSIDSAPWRQLEGQRAVLEGVVRATGRIQLADGSVLGSAARVAPCLFMTTRGVAERFAVTSGRSVRLIEGRLPMINMRAEFASAGDVHAITRVVLIHPYWDIAIVEVQLPESDLGVCLPLATNEPAEGIDIVVVGHPGRNEEENDLLSKVFENRFDVKRLMPGRYVGERTELSLGRTVIAGSDNAIALSADPGAPVVDVQTGELIGVRFSWVFLESASFVPMWELARDPALADALSLSGPPLPPPAWLSAWSAVAPARRTLLDAYVARTSGDLERARALLDTVDADDRATTIDRALLRAACELTVDRLRAADLLQGVVDHTPRDAWPDGEREAVVATRLRLVVDADAEREFLQILHERPSLARLLEKGQFRVLAPPGGNLRWSVGTDRATLGVLDPLRMVRALTELSRVDSRDAAAIAQKIVDASNRCLSLRGWIASNGRELADFTHLFSHSSEEVRELAAAYVAYPFEMVRPIVDFLLDKTDLAPHPTKGWAPAVEPLFMMLRDTLGWLPDGVKSANQLEAWLDANAKSGRLGSYLTDFKRVDTQVAWQAGLLHLTTELPIERVLKRRFSGQNYS